MESIYICGINFNLYGVQTTFLPEKLLRYVWLIDKMTGIDTMWRSNGFIGAANFSRRVNLK